MLHEKGDQISMQHTVYVFPFLEIHILCKHIRTFQNIYQYFKKLLNLTQFFTEVFDH